MGRFEAGFLVGFGVCLILTSIGPFYVYAVVDLILNLEPDHPAAKGMRMIVDLLKINKYAYETFKSVCRFFVSYYYLLKDTIPCMFHVFVLEFLVGVLMVVEGILRLKKRKSY